MRAAERLADGALERLRLVAPGPDAAVRARLFAALGGWVVTANEWEPAPFERAAFARLVPVEVGEVDIATGPRGSTGTVARPIGWLSLEETVCA